MSEQGRTERAAAWMYRGVWAALVQLFALPEKPPELPAGTGRLVRISKPAPEFLAYMKFFFWIGLLAVDVALIAGWVVILVAAPVVGLILAAPVWVLAIVPDIIVYIALHLRYDTTWYLLSDRCMRVRRGIWVIHETTITYENIQNVTVRQGPIQRWYGIADVVVQTAGGGGGGPKGHGGGAAHTGIVEGIADAPAVRDLIMSSVRQSQTAGLGDERHAPATAPGWTVEHIAALRQIRDVAARLSGGLAR